MTEEKKTDALEKKGPSALAIPEYLKGFEGVKTGTEHIGKEDMQMPRVRIAQKMSHQLEKTDAKYIEGLEFGQVFNDVTGVIYETPLKFTVIRADAPRAIEFRPFDEGGGVIDLNVPINDPRTRWHGSERPQATVFYDYFLMLVPSLELAALSLKQYEGHRLAQRLNSLMKLRFGPPFTQLYELDVIVETNDKGTFGVYTVKNAGAVSEEVLKLSEGSFNEFKDKPVLDHEKDGVTDAEVVDATEADNAGF